MSSLESRTHLVKPLLVKAGIPAALSIVAYICARIISKPSPDSSNDYPSSTQSDQDCAPIEPRRDSESFHSLGTTSDDDDDLECDDQGTTTGLPIGEKNNLQTKLVVLESQLETLQRKEWDMKSRFLRYRAFKEKEIMLMEIKNKMLLEKARAEFLLQEISLMQDENERVGGLVILYVELLYQLEGLKTGNRLLQRKARKLCRRAKVRLTIIGKQRCLIKARNKELLSNQKELGSRANIIQELEDQLRELKEAVDHLQREKIELTNKLNFAEKSHSSITKIEITEGVTKEEYDKVLKELEQLQKDQAVEANELTYLRWSNACLRDELVRYHEQQEHNKGEYGNQIMEFEFEEQGHGNGNYDMHNLIETLSAHNNDPCVATTSVINGQSTSKRRRFMQKFKRWVEGGQTDEKEKNEIRCFGKHSVCEEPEDMLVHARKSCSSV